MTGALSTEVPAQNGAADPRAGREPLALDVPTGWSWPEGRITAFVAALHVAAATPALFRVLFVPNAWTGPGGPDWQTHAIVGSDLLFPHWWNPGLPHFLLHLPAKLASGLGGDPRLGLLLGSLVLVGAYGAMLFLLLWQSLPSLGPRRRSVAAGGLSLAIALAESPAGLLGWSYNLPPDFFMPFNNPAAPTSLASRPFSLALFLITWWFLQDPEGRARTWLLPAVVLAMLAKPVLPPMVLLAAVGYAIVHRHDAAARVRAVGIGVRMAVPIALIAGVQWLILQTQPPFEWISPDPMEKNYGHGFVIRPFAGIADLGGQKPVFWAAILLPLLGIVLLRSQLRGTILGFATWTLVIGMIPFVLLYGDGHAYSGETLNFAQHGVLILSIVVICAAADRWSADPVRWQRPVLALGAVGLLYLASGLFLWSCGGGGVCVVH